MAKWIKIFLLAALGQLDRQPTIAPYRGFSDKERAIRWTGVGEIKTD